MQETEDDFIILYAPDLPNTLIKDIPEGKIVELFETGKKGYDLSLFEGGFAWQDGAFYALVRLNWSRKFWDSTLGLGAEMDLMKQILEMLAAKLGIENINLQDQDEYCYLGYDILLPQNLVSMQEAFSFADSIVKQVDMRVEKIKMEVKALIKNKLVEMERV